MYLFIFLHENEVEKNVCANLVISLGIHGFGIKQKIASLGKYIPAAPRPHPHLVSDTA